MKNYFLFLFYFLPFTMLAQYNETQQLAREYFQQQAYDKALPYYEKIYQISSPIDVYEEYLTCLIELKKWKEAEKIIQTRKNKYPLTIRYYVDELELLHRQNNTTQFNKRLRQNIETFKKSESMLADFLVLLRERNLEEAALLVAQEGTKLYPFSLTLQTELAALYQTRGEAEKAIATLFELFENNPQFTETQLKEHLLNMMINEKTTKVTDAIQSILMDKIQKKPTDNTYVALLIWYYTQQALYEKALTQAKAVDRRTKNDGFFSLQTAKTFYELKQYSFAKDALQFVLSFGEKGLYYNEAHELYLQVRFDEILQSPNPTPEEIIKLKNDINQAFQSTYKAEQRFELLEKLVVLNVYYLKQSQETISLLENELKSSIYTNVQRGKLKLNLADVQTIDGDPWEAALLYSQVEKAFENDTLGSYAKFCKARLFYFMGEIEYAQGQLDILRGATSKTTANDAMELSLRIQFSIDYDSSLVPLQKLARAEWLMFGWKFDEAIKVIDTILNNFPDHPIQDYAQLLQGQIYERKQLYNKAIDAYQQVRAKGSSSFYADDATYYLARLYDQKLQQLAEAKKYYEELIFNYPGSYYLQEVLPRYRQIRGDKFQP